VLITSPSQPTKVARLVVARIAATESNRFMPPAQGATLSWSFPAPAGSCGITP